MPRYDFACPDGHATELTLSRDELPESIICHCGETAPRRFAPPIAVIFKGPGFYSTDVTGRVGRKRRKNVGDSLHKEFDHAAARIADAI